MSGDPPHPSAFFCLVPRNRRAQDVVNHSQNAHLVRDFRHKDTREHIRGLDIGLYIPSTSRYTLATIGRCGEIFVEGTGISRIQCSFEFHEENREELMLQDRSSNKSTQLLGKTAVPFESWRTHRRVVIDETVNLEFGFGGVACDLYRFYIYWYERNKIFPDFRHRKDDPCETRTVLDEPPTSPPSFSMTRIHTPTNTVRIRYSKRRQLGNGTFGEVWKVANIDSGEYLAAKQIQRPEPNTYKHQLLKREVETLSRLEHRHIVEYRDAQWTDELFIIIMSFKPGNVADLIQKDLYTTQPKSVIQLLHHMLQALDYLASKSIIHRDVKPENILYTPIPASTPEDEGYLYQLADFGLANIVSDARTLIGSRMYMAPELEYSPQLPQTPKIDVWSLFVTIAYAANTANFRGKPQHTTPLRIQAISEAADAYPRLKTMAMEDPAQRATAGDILDKIFSGQGRTTRNNQTYSDVMHCDEPEPEQHEQRVPVYSSSMSCDEPEPGPSVQPAQQEAIADDTSRREKQVRAEAERSPEAVASERRSRRDSDGESEKQLPASTVQRRTRRSEPQLSGASPDA